jgi:DNA uptake protein ComE-like DNA-binding protein
MLWNIRVAVAAGIVAVSLAAVAANFAGQVDVNRATVQELMRVPGMTEVWARRVVHFRPYRTKLDLLQQGVVTPEVYGRIRDGVVAHHLSEKR